MVPQWVSGTFLALLSFTSVLFEGEALPTRRKDGQFHKNLQKGNETKHGLNFMSTSLNSYKEKEVRISYGGLLIFEMETPEQEENGLFYRQITNGKALLQMVFKSKDQLVDCDIEKEDDILTAFYTQFYGKDITVEQHLLHRISKGYAPWTKSKNATVHILKKGEKLDKQYADMLDFKKLRHTCHEFQHEAKRILKEDQEARKQGKDVKSDAHSRAKRSMLIYPGTKWCGKGSVSTDYYDLGESVDTDKCCRQHDHCPHMIEGFSSRYGIFNYRYYTISNCQCDIEFYSCLKNAGTSIANMVGSIYFNVMGTKCFDMETEKTCSKHSWWGKCIKYKEKHSATVQAASTY